MTGGVCQLGGGHIDFMPLSETITRSSLCNFNIRTGLDTNTLKTADEETRVLHADDGEEYDID